MTFHSRKFFRKKISKAAIGGIVCLGMAYLIPRDSSMGGDLVPALTIVGIGLLAVVLLVLLYRLLRFLSGKVFFRVRNRIIAHYVLAGLLPLLLLGLFFYVGAYFFMLQLISFHLTDMVEDDASRLTVIAHRFALTALDTAGDSSALTVTLDSLIEEMRRDFGELDVIWYRPSVGDDNASEVIWSSMARPLPFCKVEGEEVPSFLVDHDTIYLTGRADFSAAGQPAVMLVCVPVMGVYRSMLAEKFDGDIFFSYGVNVEETIKEIEPKASSDAAEDDPAPAVAPRGYNINMSAGNGKGINIDGMDVRADEWYANSPSGFGHLISYSLRPAVLLDGPDSAMQDVTVIVLVSTRYVKIVATFVQGAVPRHIPMQKVLLWMIVILAGLFGFIELIALMISLVLSHSITSMIAQLHQKTNLISKGSFQYRIDSSRRDQLGELARSFDRMSDDLVKLLSEVKEKERLEHELMIAQEVQRTFFPQTLPRVDNIQILGRCLPARMVSGDYYDFLDHGEFLDFHIGDISGKGISAALLMAGSQTFMKLEAAKRPLEPVAEIVAAYNDHLCSTTKDGRFSTLFYGRLNKATREINWCNGGHLHPFVLRNGELIRLGAGGIVPGVLPGQPYEEGHITLDEGDLFVAFTDGFTEVFDREQEEFGEERLADFLISMKHDDLDDIFRLLVERLNTWSEATDQADDMTILMMAARSNGDAGRIAD